MYSQMPYFGYGYQGMGGRAPYSEEMFEQDFEEPVEKEPPKETPVTNSTVPDTNTTVSNPANQGGNATISGPSVTGNRANSLGLQSKMVDESGLSTPSPTTHVSGGNGAAQEALEPSGHQPNSPNLNIIQSFPPASQLSTGHVAHIYNPHSEMGDARYNTLTSRGNSPIQTENQLHSFDYRENLDPRDNFQSTNNNQALENPRPISYRHQEQSHFPGRSPSGQRERKHFPTSDPLSEWNKDPVYRENYQNNSPPEGTSLDLPIDRLGQHSGMQQSNAHSQQEIFSATRTPFETEIHQYDWKQQMSSRPDHEREQFPPAQNQMWNNRENSWVFQDTTPPRYKTMYSLDSAHQRGQAVYSYQQNGHPVSPGTWEESKGSPIISSANQRKSLSYSPPMPSNQMQNTYYRRVQEENEPPPKQNPWTHENNLLDFGRQYKNPPYDPAQHQMYSRYSTEAAANERHNLPYEKINQWAQEKPILVPGTEHLKQVENIPYDTNTNGIFGQNQNMMKQGSDSPPQGTTLSQRGSQYDERNQWVSPILEPFPRKETLHYFNTYSTNFRRKSDDDTDDASKITQGSAPVSGVNVAGRRYNPDTLRYLEDYTREHRTATPHSTANHLCCVGDSPVTKEGLPAPLRSAPQFRLALWGQTERSAYPEGSHGKHARHAPFPAGIQSSQTLLMGKNQKERLGTFIEEVTGLQKKLPCSKSKLSQDDLHETNCETGLPAVKSTYNYANNLRGDRHSIPVQMMEERESRQELGQADLKLVPETFPGPQRMRSETFGNEDGRKEEHAAVEVKRIPCFATWLKQYLSSTRAPSGDQKHNLFHGDTLSPTSRPNSRPPESKPIASTNPSYDNMEEKHLKFSSPGEEWVEQPNETTPDCLLLQNK